MSESTITLTAPPLTRLNADISAGQAALDRARAAAALTGAGAYGFSRFSIYCKTPAEVNAIAAQWGVTARWGSGYYLAEVRVDGAAIEVVFYGSHPVSA